MKRKLAASLSEKETEILTKEIVTTQVEVYGISYSEICCRTCIKFSPRFKIVSITDQISFENHTVILRKVAESNSFGVRSS